jgi:hypothetical protein
MFRSRPSHVSPQQRPFWLLVALALMLLVSVSITVAAAASPIRLAGTLQRDLGALRAQLEQIDPWRAEGERRSVAFNADLGDGSPAFRRQTLVTMLHAAGRRLERLIAACRDDESRRRAATLRLDMVELAGRVDRLIGATSPTAVVAARGEVEATLDRLERDLALLSASQRTMVPLAGGPARR